jgi:uncharacterized RDD family membrane protein YckC
VKRHELDVVSLVFGLIFLGAAVIWGFSDSPGPPLDGWPLPTLLILVGVAGLVASFRRRRSGDPGPLD